MNSTSQAHYCEILDVLSVLSCRCWHMIRNRRTVPAPPYKASLFIAALLFLSLSCSRAAGCPRPPLSTSPGRCCLLSAGPPAALSSSLSTSRASSPARRGTRSSRRWLRSPGRPSRPCQISGSSGTPCASDARWPCTRQWRSACVSSAGAKR